MNRAGRLAVDRGCESVLALILANSRGRALEGLTAWQTKAAVPFGGQYRIVDFVLSNCVNSEIRKIALLTQYKSQSLIRHVHNGWGFLHRELGEFIEIWPAQQQDGERWYRGTVDAVYQNSDLIDAAGASHVLVLAGDQVYALDYGPLIEAHVCRRRGSDSRVRARSRRAASTTRYSSAPTDASSASSTGRRAPPHRAARASPPWACSCSAPSSLPSTSRSPHAARRRRTSRAISAAGRALGARVRPRLRRRGRAPLLAAVEHRRCLLARAHGAPRQRRTGAAGRRQLAGVHAPPAFVARARAR